MFITAVSVLFLIKLYDDPRTKAYKKRISVGHIIIRRDDRF